ncbi:MAG: lysophospholipid acyltransferase family protein [Myxococcaceae bacterium]
MLPPAVRRPVAKLAFDGLWGLLANETVEGRENLPDGPVLFVCNHLSNADGITLSRAFRPRTVFFLAGVKLQTTASTKLGTEVVDTIPIHPGTADIEALRKALAVLKQGDSVLIFPEGGRSRTGALIRARRGASLLAEKARVPVVPIALIGTEKLMPINDTDMSKERMRSADVKVRIGRPFRVEDLKAEVAGAEDERQALVDAMMKRVAALLPQEYRGDYAEHEEAEWRSPRSIRPPEKPSEPSRS